MHEVTAQKWALMVTIGLLLWLTGPVSVEGAIVVGVDGTRRVTVCVPVQGVVSVARHVDAFSGMAGVVVDWFAERPAGSQLRKIADWAEDAARTSMDWFGSSYVLWSWKLFNVTYGNVRKCRILAEDQP